MKLTKSKLKQLIKEELKEIESRLPQARDFGSTEPEMHAQMDTQKERIKDYMEDAHALRDKMNQYIKDHENVGGGRSDVGGLTKEWRNLLDALNAVKKVGEAPRHQQGEFIPRDPYERDPRGY